MTLSVAEIWWQVAGGASVGWAGTHSSTRTGRAQIVPESQPYSDPCPLSNVSCDTFFENF